MNSEYITYKCYANICQELLEEEEVLLLCKYLQDNLGGQCCTVYVYCKSPYCKVLIYVS